MKSIVEKLKNLYGLAGRALARLQSPFLLAVRLYWGWQLSETGWGKLHNLPHVVDFFTSLNLPAPGATAVFVSLFEFIGGILLALGFITMPTCIGVVVDMFVAYITADKEAFASFFSDPGKFYNADPYTFLFAGLLILVFGPGKISVDHYLGEFFFKKKDSQV
ncbi:MAG TPA: DoxX family protein [Candidatus Acidoferrum sp.]|nr:DoxX family protein [Candidatus Acidoferrum sp.]